MKLEIRLFVITLVFVSALGWFLDGVSAPYGFSRIALLVAAGLLFNVTMRIYEDVSQMAKWTRETNQMILDQSERMERIERRAGIYEKEV